MLVLTRKAGEEVVIDGGIRLTVVAINGDRVRIGITAPPGVRVDRAEVRERIEGRAARPEARAELRRAGRTLAPTCPTLAHGGERCRP